MNRFIFKTFLFQCAVLPLGFSSLTILVQQRSFRNSGFNNISSLFLTEEYYMQMIML